MTCNTKHQCNNMSINEFIKYDKLSKEWVIHNKGETDSVAEYCHRCGKKLPVNLIKFIVDVREIWVQSYEVYCSSEKEAMDLIEALDSTAEPLGDPEYSSRLARDTWVVEKVLE